MIVKENKARDHKKTLNGNHCGTRAVFTVLVLQALKIKSKVMPAPLHQAGVI